jgi:hypothetical protein
MGLLIHYPSRLINILEEILQCRHIAIKTGPTDIVAGNFQMDHFYLAIYFSSPSSGFYGNDRHLLFITGD